MAAEPCSRCKRQVPDWFRESQHQLVTKDTVLCHVGDYLILCTPCADSLAEIFDAWLARGNQIGG